jgi:hypothetical protein
MMFLPTSHEVIPILVFREIDRRRSAQPTLLEAISQLMNNPESGVDR